MILLDLNRQQNKKYLRSKRKNKVICGSSSQSQDNFENFATDKLKNEYDFTLANRSRIYSKGIEIDSRTFLPVIKSRNDWARRTSEAIHTKHSLEKQDSLKEEFKHEKRLSDAGKSPIAAFDIKEKFNDVTKIEIKKSIVF